MRGRYVHEPCLFRSITDYGSSQCKCDGVYPQCGSCVTLGHVCSYPEDARRLNRPTQADVRSLEAEIASLRNELIRNGKHSSYSAHGTAVGASNQSESSTSTAHYSQHQLTSGIHETSAINSLSNQYPPPSSTYHELERHETHPAAGQSRLFSPSKDSIVGNRGDVTSEENASQESRTELDKDIDVGPSPSEVNVAGAISHDGSLVVHGVSSIFHNPAHVKTASQVVPSESSEERKYQNKMSRARLFSNASLQQQRENILFRDSGLELKIDLDGVNPELAFHLLNLHWNRQHYTYLISYRPAIMDSLMNGGPYINNLLLNAIYFSSSILSDRTEVRSNINDPLSAGLPFYERFRALTAEYIDKPSIPTSTAFLLCGASLVSHGRPSAGWIMCGIAYRMIIDLGCHMAVDPRRKDGTNEIDLLSDIDLEIRKRLYWGAFMTDATQSLYFGRSPSFRASQARVPQVLLDTFEELEEWTPYIDPFTPPDFPPYPSRPAYAVKTFAAMAGLFSISSIIVHTFYSIKSLRTSLENIRRIKAKTESELVHWRVSIPPELHFNPTTDRTPPPHQVTPQ